MGVYASSAEVSDLVAGNGSVSKGKVKSLTMNSFVLGLDQATPAPRTALTNDRDIGCAQLRMSLVSNTIAAIRPWESLINAMHVRERTGT